MSTAASASSFVTSDDVRLVYRDNGGEGVPLVMLHGWLQSQTAFHYQFDQLSRRVITVDFRGHGDSDKPDHGHRMARLAVDVNELLDHLRLERVDALGWSLGVSVWWSFIDLFGTSRLRRFVIVDQPTSIAGLPWMTEEDRAARGVLWDLPLVEQIVDQLCREGSALTIDGIVAGSLESGVDPADVEVLAAGMRAADGLQAAKILFDHSTQDWADVQPRIDVPTLVIGIEGSHVTTESQRSTAQRIPGAEVHIFPADVANTHFPFLQNPAAFNPVLEEFLAR
jgi:pimeloyl-ACP methyl ester carboxylesterase